MEDNWNSRYKTNQIKQVVLKLNGDTGEIIWKTYTGYQLIKWTDNELLIRRRIIKYFISQ